MTAPSTQLRNILLRWLALCRTGQETDKPAPTAWRNLAIEVLAFRAGLTHTTGSPYHMAMARFLEHSVNSRLLLELAANNGLDGSLLTRSGFRRTRLAFDEAWAPLALVMVTGKVERLSAARRAAAPR